MRNILLCFLLIGCGVDTQRVIDVTNETLTEYFVEHRTRQDSVNDAHTDLIGFCLMQTLKDNERISTVESQFDVEQGDTFFFTGRTTNGETVEIMLTTNK